MPDAVIWLTEEQLAERLQVTKTTLLNWRYRGTGPPATRIGGKNSKVIRYRLSDVLAWEQQLAGEGQKT
jgi:predicted DNA-binding transcriptional regulator AlpA